MLIGVVVETWGKTTETFIRRQLHALTQHQHTLLIYSITHQAWFTLDTDFLTSDPLSSSHFTSSSIPSSITDTNISPPPFFSLIRSTLALSWTELRRLPAFRHAIRTIPAIPDLFIAHFANLPAIFAHIFSSVFRRPLLIAIHAHDIWCPTRLVKKNLAHANHIVACNQSVLDEARRLCPAITPRSSLIYHSIAPHFLLPQQINPSSVSDTPHQNRIPNTLLAIGRCVEKKGFSTLIDALPKIRQSIPDIHLTLIGQDMNSLIPHAKKLGVDACITIQNESDNAPIIEAMRATSLLVVPSTIAINGDRDGIPNVILEAMITHTPLVTTYAGGIPEAVNDTCAWMAPPGDATYLARAIIGALTHPEQAYEYAQRAYPIALQRFSPTNESNAWEQILRQTK